MNNSITEESNKWAKGLKAQPVQPSLPTSQSELSKKVIRLVGESSLAFDINGEQQRITQYDGKLVDGVTALILAEQAALLDEIEQRVIGEKLEEADGWEWAFGDEAQCCPGDDFAYYGNHLKDGQRSILSTIKAERGL